MREDDDDDDDNNDNGKCGQVPTYDSQSPMRSGNMERSSTGSQKKSLSCRSKEDPPSGQFTLSR